MGVKTSRKRHLCTAGERLTTGPLENRKGGTGNPKPEADLAGRRSTSVLCPGQPAAGRPWREKGSRAPPAAQPPTQARTCAHTHPFPALGCRNRRGGLCGVNDPLLHQALCAVAPRPPSTRCCLKPSPWVFHAEAPRGVHGGAARGIRRRQEGKLPQLPPWKGARPQDQDPETRRRMEEENEAWPRLWPRRHRGKSLQGLRKASRHPGWPHAEARCPAKPAFLGLTVRPSSLNTAGCRQFFTEINPAKKH